MKGLKPEDYLEPACIFCTPEQETVQPIDLRRCLGRLDEYLGRNDTAAAERHLNYWKEEALAGRDLRGLLTIENERMGLYRKLGREADAQAAVRSALGSVSRIILKDHIQHCVVDAVEAHDQEAIDELNKAKGKKTEKAAKSR